MKRLIALLSTALAAALALTACSSGGTPSSNGSAAGGTKTYTIGVLVISQATLFDQIVSKFEDAVTKGVGDQATVKFDVQNANGDQSLITSIARDFASSKDDAFAVLGTPAVAALASQVGDRPIFAIAMGDPVGAGVAASLKKPGKNVTGSIDYVDPSLLLGDLMSLYPSLKTVGTIYDPSNQNMQVWVKALEAATQAKGVKLTETTVASSSDVSQAARSLVGRAGVVLVGPDSLVLSGMDAVGAVMAGSSIPLFVVGGDLSVSGVLGTMGPNYPELGTAAGQGAVKVLLGTDPGTVPFAVPNGLDIAISKSLAGKYGLTIPSSLKSRVSEQ